MGTERKCGPQQAHLGFGNKSTLFISQPSVPPESPRNHEAESGTKPLLYMPLLKPDPEGAQGGGGDFFQSKTKKWMAFCFGDI